jgi:hypothetical protein
MVHSPSGRSFVLTGSAHTDFGLDEPDDRSPIDGPTVSAGPELWTDPLIRRRPTYRFFGRAENIPRQEGGD